MVTGAWYTVLANHVDHFLMTLNQGEMMFEDLVHSLARALKIMHGRRYFRPWNMSGRFGALTSPSLRSTSKASTLVLGKRAFFWRICHGCVFVEFW